MVDPDARTQPEPSGARLGPPAPPLVSGRRRPECEPIPKPHRGGDALHNWCADTFPPNAYPGKDVLVDGKLFDALQVGAPVLWEIKTDRFEAYSVFLQAQVVGDQVEELRREKRVAETCGYGFVVGVSSAAHKIALEQQERLLNIVVTECKR
ncbi:hypothetical protein D7X74_25520 [Corallococcus sp. CA047B]|nr:hypothetical protein D7X74_25520 [Corallococcus sp. CA047B]